jgi:hypothetical protein
MKDILDKIKTTSEQFIERIKTNAKDLRGSAEDLSKVTRLKFELRHLKLSKKRKYQLLGETVYPFLDENKVDALKTHETLPVLMDEIKSLSNQIELINKSIEEISETSKDSSKVLNREDLRGKIQELEEEIESRLEELKIVKEAINKES